MAANTNYQLTGWVRTSSNSDNAFLGARTTGNVVLSEANFPKTTGWQKFTVNFNSGSHTAIQVFAGFCTDHADICIQMDDFYLVAY